MKIKSLLGVRLRQKISQRGFRKRTALFIFLFMFFQLISPFGSLLERREVSAAGYWRSTSVGANAPTDRTQHTAVWTGETGNPSTTNKMIIWGGSSGTGYLNTGGIYDVATDSWTSTSTVNAPQARRFHNSVWINNKMFVWGGYIWVDDNNMVSAPNGGVYDPLTDSWGAISSTNAPTGGVQSFVGKIDDSRILVWGGYAAEYGVITNSGAIYNISNNTWTPISSAGAPNLINTHMAVVGDKFMVWGGDSTITISGTPVNEGAIYSILNNTWASINLSGAPTVRRSGIVSSNSEKILIEAGYDGVNYLNDAYLFNPTSNAWSNVPSRPEGLPNAQNGNIVYSFENKSVVWGGFNWPQSTSVGYFFDFSNNTWTLIPTEGSPAARTSSTTVWTGTEVVIWGGFAEGGVRTNTGGIFNPTMSPPVVPTITTQPANQTVTAGNTATFSVVANNGGGTLSYQWQSAPSGSTTFSNISGATSASYTTPSTATGDTGKQYKVVVTNSAGSVTSSAATLTVNTSVVAPTITTQPANRNVTVGNTATFSVVANNGGGTLSYQWQSAPSGSNTFGNISGANSGSYTTPATQLSDSGKQYRVIVTNSAGSVTSSAATLSVSETPPSDYDIFTGSPSVAKGGAQVDFGDTLPSNVESGFNISIESSLTSQNSAPAGFSIVRVFDINPSKALTGSYLATITLDYPAGSRSKSGDYVAYWDGSSWSTDGIETISDTEDTITFTTSHFTDFAILSAVDDSDAGLVGNLPKAGLDFLNVLLNLALSIGLYLLLALIIRRTRYSALLA